MVKIQAYIEAEDSSKSHRQFPYEQEIDHRQMIYKRVVGHWPLSLEETTAFRPYIPVARHIYPCTKCWVGDPNLLILILIWNIWLWKVICYCFGSAQIISGTFKHTVRGNFLSSHFQTKTAVISLWERQHMFRLLITQLQQLTFNMQSNCHSNYSWETPSWHKAP